MLEKIDLNKKIDKQQYKEQKDALNLSISELARELRLKNIPVIILFEGMGAAGKGVLMNQLIEPLDPRGYKVFATSRETEDEKMHPFLWRFFTKTPPRGVIHLFDGSWYRRVLTDRFDKTVTKQQYKDAYQEINSFEKQLTDDHTLIIKFFLYISEKEQAKRFKKLRAVKSTAWRVSEGDLKRNRNYYKFIEMIEEMLRKTDTAYAPWTIVEAENEKYATIQILSQVERCFRDKLAQAANEPAPVIDGKFDTEHYQSSLLKKADLSKTLTRDQYKIEVERLQKRLCELHGELYRKRIPVVLAFEGWDAGGKGGAIKRLIQALDPRGYTVNPTSSPNDIERAHHYLWRFWQKMPKDGHIAVFDRTWYGRVMVERIEGFCSQSEWERAYQELNDMEEQLAAHGTVIIKFWMQIDKNEQERRFTLRQNTPSKQWKITDEDWRNREKWDLYEQAVDEMMIKTSTTYAPWVIIEGNCKLHARVKVLQTVVDALEKKLSK